MYWKYCYYELRLFMRTHANFIAGITTLIFYGIIGLALWSLWVQEGSWGGVLKLSAKFLIRIIRFIPERLGIISSSSEVEEKYDVNDSYGDPKVLTTGLLKDLKSVGLKAGRRDILTLLQVALAKGKPVDDKLMTVSVQGYGDFLQLTES